VLLPDFALEHPDGRRAILEIMGFWTPEYLEEKLDKIRQADVENLVLAVSEELDCTSEDIDLGADRVLWFKTGSTSTIWSTSLRSMQFRHPLLVPE
jgi:predicted nuclease of restriction endonuclease-like RecB superfamily